MGVSTVQSAAVFGLRVELVNVEADVGNGLPAFHMVGYLSSEVKEAGERVRTAIRNSGLEFPAKKTVINLSPATIRKRGAAFDLPIAIAILTSLGTVAQKDTKGLLILGELGLDGASAQSSGSAAGCDGSKKAGNLPLYDPVRKRAGSQAGGWDGSDRSVDFKRSFRMDQEQRRGVCYSKNKKRA